jgi:hypothetical protein
MTSMEPDIATLVASRLSRLRELAATDPDAAREEGWAWIVELGHRLHRHRESALAELATLFATGKPSTTLDGQTEGTQVSFTVHPVVDGFFATVTQAWMPWLGKRFDALEHRGDNTLLASARWPAKVVWPFYRMRHSPLGLSAFDFTTRVERSVLDPEHDVLHIDYGVMPGNPRVIIKSLRDELVEIVPGAHLGKMIWTGGGAIVLLAYFALRGPAR